jgi:osmotically-inducible protein OsmY
MQTVTSDKTMRESIERELEWDAQVDPSHIAITANNGAIVLSGHVPTWAQKAATLKATERLYGVRAVADNLEVKLSNSDRRNDGDIAEDLTRHLRSHTAIPDGVRAEVSDGHVTLRGQVSWPYQRTEAARTVRYLRGVKGVEDLITVKPPQPEAADISHRIGEAIERMAHLDARSVWATTSNSTVKLHGHVHSFSEKHTAGLVAASAPGVTKVENEVLVTP